MNNFLVTQRDFKNMNWERIPKISASFLNFLKTEQGQKRLKRIMDIYLVSLMVVLLIPLFLLIGILIKMTSRGPVFFQQKRAGFKGKVFTILKFRTMSSATPSADHERLIKEILGPTSDKNGNNVQSYKNQIETHITKVGRLLRKTSLDELPQLFNVLRGDLSLVGPRPHPLYEVENYKDWYQERFRAMPGITGLSKVILRCTPEDYDESMRLDLEYVKNWSIGLDLKIILKTIPLVLRMTNAY